MLSLLLIVAAVSTIISHQFTVIEAQFTCVASCDSNLLIGRFSDIRECCITNSGGGYLKGGGPCTSCIPIRVVDPQISFSFNPEVPVVGQPFTGLCTATISPALSGNILLEWKNENGTIIGSNNITGSSAESSFIIDSFKMTDSTVIGGYTCRAEITAENDTEKYSIILERNILFTSTPSSTSITTTGDFIAGSQFQLTCTVMGVIMTPMIVWFGPQGMISSTTNGIELGDIVAMGDTYSRSLFFTSLTSDQTGRYVCMNTVTDPPTVEQTLFLAERRISTTSSTALGRPFTASCEVSVPDSLEATVQTVLLDPTGRELASSLGLNSSEAVFLLPSLQISDLGQYTCRSSVFSNQLNTPVITEQSFSIEIDNCVDNSSRCLDIPNSQCVETINGPSCQCLSGYMIGPESQCINIDECYLGIDDCDYNANCTDTVGSFSCFCRVGYSGNGTTCIDTDECFLNMSDCNLTTMTCINTNGSFTCIDKSTEVDILSNECVNGEAMCDINAICTDTVDSFTCECNEGFIGNGHNCWDINECSMELDECDDNAQCINLPGAYLCRCNDGYFGTGYTCKSFIEDEPDDPPINCVETATTTHTTHTKSRSYTRCPDDEEDTTPRTKNSRTKTGTRSRTTGTGTSGSRKTGTGTSGSRTTGTGTSGSRTTGTGTSGSRKTGTGTSGSRTTGTGTSGSRTTGTGTSGSRTTGTGTSGSRTTGTGTSGSRKTGTGTSGTRTTGTGSGTRTKTDTSDTTRTFSRISTKKKSGRSHSHSHGDRSDDEVSSVTTTRRSRHSTKGKKRRH